jgi:uncharacterized protein YkwD
VCSNHPAFRRLRNILSAHVAALSARRESSILAPEQRNRASCVVLRSGADSIVPQAENRVNSVDLGLGLLILLQAWEGYRRGFWRGVFELLGWIVGIGVALRFYRVGVDWLAPRAPWPAAWNAPIAFVLLASIASVVIGMVGAALLRSRQDRTNQRRQPPTPRAHVLGIVPGTISGIISAAIVAALLLALPLPATIRTAARESVLANRLAGMTDRAETALRPIFDDAINQTLTALTVQPESNERVDLSFTVADAPPLPELETQMLALVNRERAAVGLPPLAPDPALTEVARLHSADMFARGYFAHVDPDGRDPFDRIDAAGITYLAAGENLALAPTLELAHSGLMNSPGHRANILRPQFGRAGIGILDGGARGIMVTQLFRD